MNAEGCATTCTALVQEIECLVAGTSLASRFALDLKACKKNPPVDDLHSVERYERAGYIASIGQNAAYLLMHDLALDRIPRERARVISYRKLDAATYALQCLADDRTTAPKTESWDAMVLAMRDLTDAYTATTRLTDAWLDSTRKVVLELERDLGERKLLEKDATALALETIAYSSAQAAQVITVVNLARTSLHAVDVRADVDVSDLVLSKKRNPGKTGPLPNALLGEILLRLQHGSGLTRLDPPVRVAIIATRPKYVYTPKERKKLVDDGFGTMSDPERRQKSALEYAISRRSSSGQSTA